MFDFIRSNEMKKYTQYLIMLFLNLFLCQVFAEPTQVKKNINHQVEYNSFTPIEEILNEFGKNKKYDTWNNFLGINKIKWNRSNSSWKNKEDDYREEVYFGTGSHRSFNSINGKFKWKDISNTKEHYAYFRIYKDYDDNLMRIDIGKDGYCIGDYSSKKECLNDFKKQFNNKIKIYDSNYIQCKNNYIDTEEYLYMNLEFNNMIFYLIVENQNFETGRIPSGTVYHIFNDIPYSYVGAISDLPKGYCKLFINK